MYVTKTTLKKTTWINGYMENFENIYRGLYRLICSLKSLKAHCDIDLYV